MKGLRMPMLKAPKSVKGVKGLKSTSPKMPKAVSNGFNKYKQFGY